MKKQISLLVLFFGFSALHAASGHLQKSETDTIKKVAPLDISEIFLKDDPIAMRLDSLMHFSIFSNDTAHFATEEFTKYEKIDDKLVPDFSDSIYEERIKQLDAQSPLDLDYNIYVKRYIHVYTKKRREQVSRMLGLAKFYFPLFEEALDRHDIPLELKYLAIVESALNPLARSRVGATGLWQFMYATGKMNGLNVSSYIDERSDPIKSTEAACKYLSQLYGIFGDWNLALAAYNSGPGNVSKAIRRSGGKTNYWEIRSFLPRETAGYVPAFIAVNYIMNFSDEHFIYASNVKPSYFNTDTLAIKSKLSLDQIASLIDMPVKDLEFLNPAYRHKIIPQKKKGSYYNLMLPKSKMGLFVANEDSIYSIAQRDFEKKKKSLPAYVEHSDRVRHKVRSGEFLGSIARKYGVSVSSIKRWNGLRSDNLRIGQRLTIHPRRMPSTTASKPKKSSTTKASKTKTPKATGDFNVYVVQNGDSFYSIAKNYPGISAQNIMDWNDINNAKRLKPGMSLKIFTKI